MIKASEARKLTEASEETINRILDKIDPIIRRQAAAGKNSTLLGLIDGMSTTEESYIRVEANDLQMRVMAALHELGYLVTWHVGEEYVPRGLANDDGDGPKHRTWSILVGW